MQRCAIPDAGYTTSNMFLKSRGIMARPVEDVPPGESFFLNENSFEEIEEGGVATRLGTSIVNRTGSTINALPSLVHSLGYLGSLSGNAYRYAGLREPCFGKDSCIGGILQALYWGSPA